MAKQRRAGIGIDIGGTGIKGGLVDLDRGRLIGERLKVSTPEGASVEAVRDAVVGLVTSIREQPKAEKYRDLDLPIGICLPSIIKHGVSWTAANIAPEWIGFDARTMFTAALGREVAIANDADAAGLAEVRFGDADTAGSTLVITLGTGIGSALIHDGRLFPNTELGHLELDGHPDYERFASSKVREREGLDDATWCARLTPYFRKLERLFGPDRFVISGGISKRAHEFLPLIDIETPLLTATLKNNAGIIGAAILGDEGWR